MKVNAWKNIDVECEVEVSIDDCINELLAAAHENGMPNRKLQAIDGATKILEKITPDMLADVFAKNRGAVEIIRHRLQKWIDAT